MSVKEKGKGNDILAAATEIFAENGFHNATIGDIAGKAGIGKGTVYEYFSSKNDLFIQVIEQNAARYRMKLKAQVSSAQDFLGKLHEFMMFHYDMIKQNKKFVDIMFQHGGMALDAETKKKIRDCIRQSRQYVLKILGEIFSLGQKEGKVANIDKDFTADVFYDMVLRVCIRNLFFDEKEESLALEETKLTELLLKGIGTD